MAFGTILAITIGVLVIFPMAAITILGSHLQLCNRADIGVATAATDRSMLTGQFVINRVVIEPFTVRIYTIMALQAEAAKGVKMCLSKNGIHATMAIEADHDIEFSHALHMAIETLKRFAG